MTVHSVSECVALALAQHVSDVFGVMGNGNAFFLDAAERSGMRFTAVRHEGGAIPAADAYYRASGRLAAATTTYGAGFTNALTGLAESVQAQIPVVLVTGDCPTSGPRPWDVNQPGITTGLGAPTFTVTLQDPSQVALQAIEHALTHRTLVVIAIPYDIAAAPVLEEPAVPAINFLELVLPDESAVRTVANVLSTAKRPLIVAGRGAHLSEAGSELQILADQISALTATTALARNLFPSNDGHLGIAGGFGTQEAARLMAEADVVLIVGARLNQFTMRFGELINEAATVIQIDLSDAATHPRVDVFLRGDARKTALMLLDFLRKSRNTGNWRTSAAPRFDKIDRRHPGFGVARDGRLDPRSVAAALDKVLPMNRTVVQDGGHFIGWAPMYWEIPGPQSLIMVGTAYQSIGLGLASAVGAATACPNSTLVLATGDGGLLMALADLESVVRTVRSGVIVVFNDAAYGAEIHQYGSQGLTEQPMIIPEIDFAGIAVALGAQGATIRSLNDLDRVDEWIKAGAEGVFLADCRVSVTVRSPWMDEAIEASAKADASQTAAAGL